MPTYFRSDRFIKDLAQLTPQQLARFEAAARAFVEDLRQGRGFRPGLRVKGVRGRAGVYELAWAPDGRATWEYGPQQQPGEPHIRWRRIGTHGILRNP